MEIKIEDHEDLKKSLEILALEIVNASYFFELYRNLQKSTKEYGVEISQSNVFWVTVLEALQDSWMIKLCRVYDSHSKGLNLYNFLDTIQVNLHLFETHNFKERMKDNKFVELLALANRMPDEEQLDKDLLFAGTRNPLVKKLILWRGNLVAHRNAKIALGKDEKLNNNPLTFDEIQTLLDNAHEILNRYADKYIASRYPLGFPGQDDYKILLEHLRRGQANS